MYCTPHPNSAPQNKIGLKFLLQNVEIVGRQPSPVLIGLSPIMVASGTRLLHNLVEANLRTNQKAACVQWCRICCVQRHNGLTSGLCASAHRWRRHNHRERRECHHLWCLARTAICFSTLKYFFVKIFTIKTCSYYKISCVKLLRFDLRDRNI